MKEEIIQLLESAEPINGWLEPILAQIKDSYIQGYINGKLEDFIENEGSVGQTSKAYIVNFCKNLYFWK